MRSDPDPGADAGLVAVVVTFNRLDKLKVTLARLLETPECDLAAVLVVDNASDDGTADWLAGQGTGPESGRESGQKTGQNGPRLMVHRSATNTGGAGGFETGMRLAMARFDPDWLVVMDDDARPEPGALRAFHGTDNRAWDAVAAAVYLPNGEICDMNRPARNPFWHRRELVRTLLGAGRRGFHASPGDYAGPGMAVDVASFVGLFISRGAVARVGYPDGGLFVYGDDGLYTLGLARAGGRIRFDPNLRFVHDCSTFAQQQEGQQGQQGRFKPLWKVYYYHRNLLLLYRLAAGAWFWPVMLVILPKWLMKTRAHTGQRLVFLRLLGRAVRDGLTGRTGVDHEVILALSGSGYPGDSAPEEEAP